MPAQQSVLTREGHQKLEQELHHLSTVRRKHVSRSLHEALQEGDLLENAGLENALNEWGFLEGRIQTLTNVLSTAMIIEEQLGPRDTVGLGSTVSIVELGGNGIPETYRIVGSIEADPIQGSISDESPLGRELVGRKVGKQVVVEAPDGSMTFEIVEVR